MTKNLLTVLGCSGSIALTLGIGEAAQGNNVSPIRELVFTASDSPEMVAEDEFDCLCTGEATEGDFLNNDRLGDAAIAQYGCDCAGCRFIVREQMQAENQAESAVIQ
jgi:hypothetical protein